MDHDIEGPYYYRNGAVWFCTNDVRLRMAEEVEQLAVAFDQHGVLLKHGKREDVEAYRDLAQRKLEEAVPGFANFTVISLPVSEESVIEINRCINITGYAQKYLFDPDHEMRSPPGAFRH